MSTAITKLALENGLKRCDARKSIELELTPGDIAHASKKDPANCAFARACKRTFNADNAYFFRGTAWLERDGKLTRYMLPSITQKEIMAFDRGGNGPGDVRFV